METKQCKRCHEVKNIENYYSSDKARGYFQPYCKECEKINKTEWRRLRREDNRARILHYLGGKYECPMCNFTHNTSSPFDWHHNDGEIKHKSPMLMIHDNWKKLKKELDKCTFLCSNCHRILHHG